MAPPNGRSHHLDTSERALERGSPGTYVCPEMDRLDHVLVIDSDLARLASTTMLLEAGGFSVISASSGSQVAEALKPGPPRVVVIEPTLNDRDGFELCRSIIDSCQQAPPAVLIASRSLRGDRWGVRAKEVGAEFFIERPRQDEVLVQAVGRIMRAARNPEADLSEESPERFEAWLDQTFAASAPEPAPPTPPTPVETTAPAETVEPVGAIDELEIPESPQWSKPIRKKMLSVAASAVALIVIGGGTFAWLRSDEPMAVGTLAHAGTLSVHSKDAGVPTLPEVVADAGNAPDETLELEQFPAAVVEPAIDVAPMEIAQSEDSRYPPATDTATTVEPVSGLDVDPNFNPIFGRILGPVDDPIEEAEALPEPTREPVRFAVAEYRKARLLQDSRVEPRYPYSARQLRAGGYAELHAAIGTDGFLREIEIVDEQPSKRFGFGKAAMTAVQHWRYEPATSDGHPITSSVRLKFEFEPD